MIAYVAIVAAGACLTGAGIVIVILLRTCAALRRDCRALGRVLADIVARLPEDMLATLRMIRGGEQ